MLVHHIGTLSFKKAWQPCCQTEPQRHAKMSKGPHLITYSKKQAKHMYKFDLRHLKKQEGDRPT
jgi:hypothetical protein